MKKIICALLLVATLFSLFSFSLNTSAATDTVLTTDKTTYFEGEPIIVNAKSANASGKDWLGITVKGDKTGAAIRWNYLTEITENFDIREATRLGKSRVSLYSLPAGEYTVFIIPDDLSVKKGYDLMLASIDITVIPDPNAPKIPELTLPDKDTYIVTDKTEYVVGDTIYVAASSVNAGGTDWVGIFPKGHVGPAIYWEYISTVGKGTTFDITKVSHIGSSMSEYYNFPAGEYTLYLIPDNLNGAPGIPLALASLDIVVKEAPETTEAPDTTATPETAAPETTVPETTEPESSSDTGDSFVIFAAIAVVSILGVAIIAKRREN